MSCLVLVNLYVLVFIPSVNEHCDHYLMVFTWLIKLWFVEGELSNSKTLFIYVYVLSTLSVFVGLIHCVFGV